MYYVNKILPAKNVQDRVERSRLKKELNLIEKQKKSEMKMHESEVRNMRSRYSKTGVYSDSFSEAAGVKMYETHNPGFCYKRNGAYKFPPSVSSTPILEFQQLRSLLFTNDELDVDKILCLHMLSVHTTESLTMPNMKLLKDISKENTPIERLIERSKKTSKKRKEHQEIINILPIYVIDIIEEQSVTSLSTIRNEETEDQLFRDARINSRLIINSKVQKILVSVLSALKTSKSEKLKKLLEICNDPSFLKKIFNRLPMQEFLKMLKTYSLITSCESYILTPKIKQKPIHLEIRTNSGHLEALIQQVRKYILQIPSKTKNEWKTLYDLDEEILQDLTSSTSQNLGVFEAANIRYPNQKKSSRSVVSTVKKKKSDILEKSTSYIGNRNFLNRYLRDSEATAKKSFYTSGCTKIFSSMKLPSIASGHESDRTPVEVLRCQESEFEENEEQLIRNILPESTSIIKRSSCIACQEKWKHSLPSPKIPNYKRPGLPPQIYEDPYRISHMNRISSMISQELYKLSSYNTKYSAENVHAKIKCPVNYESKPPAENEEATDADSVEICPYGLARVSQEIADKETSKKLNQFLKEYI